MVTDEPHQEAAFNDNLYIYSYIWTHFFYQVKKKKKLQLHNEVPTALAEKHGDLRLQKLLIEPVRAC